LHAEGSIDVVRRGETLGKCMMDDEWLPPFYNLTKKLNERHPWRASYFFIMILAITVYACEP